MFNFILGFMSGIYLGTYHNDTCKPIMNRLVDCLKKEFNNKLNNLEEHANKDDSTKDN
tara:strand:- start:11058 stop:11231 length:174 start_codon:yes stop_codon:yes gene_type:complete